MENITKDCKHCWAKFEITKNDLMFYDKISPVFDWKKYEVPTPTQCPNCRHQRRLAFRNERNLYKRRCDATWKNIISFYSDDKPFKVYSLDEWWSDKWDWVEYWVDYDFNKTFFEQARELMLSVPRYNLGQSMNENSNYINYAWGNKNCYLVFNADSSEDCYYSKDIYSSKNSMDCLWVTNCELCFECVNCKDCFNSSFLQNSNNCSDSFFLNNCSWCKSCFWCVNLRNKEYCYFNKQMAKEEYLKKISEHNCWNHKSVIDLKKQFKEFSLDLPRSAMFWNNNDNVVWDYLENCKNAINCFNSKDLQDCKYVYDCYDIKDWYDIDYFWLESELLYECETVWRWARNVAFSLVIARWWSNIYYSQSCPFSNNLFGCIWLRNKEYCILNKQYTKKEYEELVPKIIEHMKSTWEWWEFFPIELSPFAYNETVAQEYFHLNRDSVIDKWWQWKDESVQLPNVSKIIPANKLPDDIKDIPDDILNWAIRCEVSNKPFKIIPQELEFYRKYNISVPHVHHDERHKMRLGLKNPRKLFEKTCRKCDKRIKTTYSSERPEKVYCEDCYLKEVY